MRPAEVCKVLSVSLSSLHRWVSIGRMPRPIRVGPRTSGWRASTIEALLRQFTPPAAKAA